jgi:hypothetical protein
MFTSGRNTCDALALDHDGRALGEAAGRGIQQGRVPDQDHGGGRILQL